MGKPDRTTSVCRLIASYISNRIQFCKKKNKKHIDIKRLLQSTVHEPRTDPPISFQHCRFNTCNIEANLDKQRFTPSSHTVQTYWHLSNTCMFLDCRRKPQNQEWLQLAPQRKAREPDSSCLTEFWLWLPLDPRWCRAVGVFETHFCQEAC